MIWKRWTAKQVEQHWVWAVSTKSGAIVLDQLLTHPRTACSTPFCALHNPSEHPLRDASLGWMPNKLTRRNGLCRRCDCGVWHPDPDSGVFVLLRYGPAQGNAFLRHQCCEHKCCGYDSNPQPHNYEVIPAKEARVWVPTAEYTYLKKVEEKARAFVRQDHTKRIYLWEPYFDSLVYALSKKP